MVEITAAAVRLFARALEIEFEVEDEIVDNMTFEELMAQSDRVLRDWEKFKNNPDAEDDEDGDDEEDEEKKAVKAALAKHREYQYVKAELGKQLQLEPTDINPLDITFDQKWASPDDPGIAIWKRAVDIYRHLAIAHTDWLCWWRPKKEPSGNVVRLRPEAKGPF